MFPGGPLALPGQRIGLLGGSFDPPHEGHLHISRWALRALALDRVWWVVSPGNPLKTWQPAPLARRLAACRALIDHPRILATDIEARMGTRFSVDTLAGLLEHYRGVRFVWLVGSDNLASLHRWHRWPWIFEHLPLAAFERPGTGLAAAFAPAARRFARWRVPMAAARLLPATRPPAWTLLMGPTCPASSTALRAAGAWP